MKICYIASSIIPSRTANSVHVMKMCQAYARLGHQVSLALYDQPGLEEPGVADVFAFYGVEPSFEILRFRPRRPLKLWLSTVLPARAQWATSADLYHTRIEWTAWGLATLFRRPTLIEVHDRAPAGGLRERCFRSSTRRRAMRGVVSITEALKEQIADLVHPSTPIVVAPDGVDSHLAQSTTTQAEARQRIGVEGERRRLAVYTGQLYPGRGVEVIVELARRHASHLFLVVGGRDEDIARWRDETRAMDNLRFVGFVPPRQVFDYLLAADVLLMPYARQVAHAGGGDTASVCSPMKMFEYLAAGRAIVASDLPVLQEVLHPGENCLLAPYESMDEWSAALSRLEQDAELDRRLGRTAHSDAQRYTWESRAAKLLELAPQH